MYLHAIKYLHSNTYWINTNKVKQTIFVSHNVEIFIITSVYSPTNNLLLVALLMIASVFLLMFATFVALGFFRSLSVSSVIY